MNCELVVERVVLLEEALNRGHIVAVRWIAEHMLTLG